MLVPPLHMSSISLRTRLIGFPRQAHIHYQYSDALGQSVPLAARETDPKVDAANSERVDTDIPALDPGVASLSARVEGGRTGSSSSRSQPGRTNDGREVLMGKALSRCTAGQMHDETSACSSYSQPLTGATKRGFSLHTICLVPAVFACPAGCGSWRLSEVATQSDFRTWMRSKRESGAQLEQFEGSSPILGSTGLRLRCRCGGACRGRSCSCGCGGGSALDGRRGLPSGLGRHCGGAVRRGGGGGRGR